VILPFRLRAKAIRNKSAYVSMIVDTGALGGNYLHSPNSNHRKEQSSACLLVEDVSHCRIKDFFSHMLSLAKN
jgi:hypothetical protein